MLRILQARNVVAVEMSDCIAILLRMFIIDRSSWQSALGIIPMSFCTFNIVSASTVETVFKLKQPTT